jgi:hypothetical protein
MAEMKAMQVPLCPIMPTKRQRGIFNNDDCVVCGSWPATDREGVRRMIYEIAPQQPVCDKCIVAFLEYCLAQAGMLIRH